jgi:trans-aconitate 2-methyltransferase
MADVWDPEQYNRFARERELPFWDLAALLRPGPGPRVADLGCGDGRLTAALHERLAAGETVGIDRSRRMIEAAESRKSDAISFELGDIGRWCQPGTFDIVVANASLHWVPDHPAVLRRWVSSLRPGGQLAVQVPANADHIAQLVAAEVAAEWLDGPPTDPVADNVLPPEAYCQLLDELACVEQHVRLQVYAHRLASTADLVEWLKGTTLTRFQEVISAQDWDRFLEQYRARLLAVLGDRSPYLYPFKRILLWGQIR